MADQQPTRVSSMTVREDQGLVGVTVVEDGQPATRFFTDEAEADAALAAGTRAALRASGAWADLDWDEAVEELDRIRHASTPSPPLDP